MLVARVLIIALCFEMRKNGKLALFEVCLFGNDNFQRYIPVIPVVRIRSRVFYVHNEAVAYSWSLASHTVENDPKPSLFRISYLPSLKRSLIWIG